MNKKDIISFFDSLAPQWDNDMIRHDDRIAEILNYAGVRSGVSVLDVACGTGVLFPDYLNCGVSKIVGVDISSEMIKIAKDKFPNPKIEIFCADIEDFSYPDTFDCCVVYNAFPHFPNPKNLLSRLALFLNPGGRLTIAHGMSRAQIDAHHEGAAKKVSNGLMHENQLAELFSPNYNVDTIVSNDRIYVVSGTKKSEA